MKRKILKSKKFPIYHYSTTISGKKISRDIVHRPNVSAIIAFKNNKILVVSQNRFPNETDIEIPSGNIEKNESPIQAAHREFLEETGYQAKEMIPLVSFYTTIGYSTQKIFCFVAKDFNTGHGPAEWFAATPPRALKDHIRHVLAAEAFGAS